MNLTTGTKIGRYTIVSELGFGGMGTVYLAEDEILGRTIALKILSVDSSQKSRDLRRFTQEARTASLLKHPNIAHIYEIGNVDDISFIAMEYVEGLTLRVHRPLNLIEVLDIGIQIANALVAAASLGIVHRDLKPENIMVSREGYIKVLDFGLAKKTEQERSGEVSPDASTISTVFTDPGSIVGTIIYMSPEQARGLPVDARADIWSLGVILYEMISGHTPFEASTVSDVISLILHHEPPPLARFSRNIPESVEWLVMKAIVKDREGRYQTAKEMLSDLQRLKRRLEAEAELETGASYLLVNSATNREPSTGFSALTQTELPGRSTTSMSSVEYIVSGIAAHKKAWLTTVVGLVLAAVGGVFAFRYLTKSSTPPAAPESRRLSRLTTGPGLQNGPSWSPDGRFIAYSTDRGSNFDIWVQPVSGGDPVQVTQSPAHDWQPDWSPDGNSIVFRSERESGGLYVIPAFGGRERKIAPFGYRPRWSPDGTRVLCLSPGDEIYTHPQVFVINLDGTAPTEVSTSAAGQAHYAKQGLVDWYPDGQQISFLSDKGGFWTIRISDGKATRSELVPQVTKQFREAAVDIGNFRWAMSGAALYFEGDSSGVSNIWKVTVDPKTLAWTSGPQRLTTGLGRDTEIALTKDGTRIAFATVTQSTRIWSLPFDSLSGRVNDRGQPATPADVEAWFPDLSRDGKKLVFASRRHGMERQELWQQTLKDGALKLLAVDQFTRIIPRWSPDGKQIAYTRFLASGPESERPYVIVLLPADGGEEQLLTSPGPWRDYVYDWSLDGQWVIGSSNRRNKERWQLALFPVSAAPHAEAQMRILASDDTSDLWAPRFSPDGRWVCYLAQKSSDPRTSIVNVVSSAGGSPVPIPTGQMWSDKPRWSPDGKTIYFISNHGSMFLNVWGIRFDPARGTAVGNAFKITSFESPGQLIPTRVSHLEMSLDQSRLFLPLTEVSGSIWVLSDVDK